MQKIRMWRGGNLCAITHVSASVSEDELQKMSRLVYML
jgi:hypothetical protein